MTTLFAWCLFTNDSPGYHVKPNVCFSKCYVEDICILYFLFRKNKYSQFKLYQYLHVCSLRNICLEIKLFFVPLYLQEGFAPPEDEIGDGVGDPNEEEEY